MANEMKVYPSCCTSMYCGTGGDACKTCRNLPRLEEFKKWVEDNNAVCEDPTWCPNVYTAKKGSRS